MKLALVYDRLNKVGGAEEILKNLHDLYPDAPWYTSTYNQKKTPFTKNWTVKSSLLSKVPILKNNHELIPFFMPYIFENMLFNDYDIVISVSSAEAKGIITSPDTLHINYCLTPTRYLWSHQQEYINSNQFHVLKKIFKPLVNYITHKLQNWDYVAAQRPDTMISISEHVKKRVKKYYKRNSTVIYPPVDVNKFQERCSFAPAESNYYLVVSRLVPYKKLDLIIKAFNKSGKTLVIVGVGSEAKRLKKLANRNIKFKGFLAPGELVGYYQNCQAFIQANEEDFGIAMVEANAAGKPVIAYEKGGASEIVTSKTGCLFAKPQIDEIIRAVDKFEKMNFSAEDCKANAARFSKEVFKTNIKKIIKETWQNYQQN